MNRERGFGPSFFMPYIRDRDRVRIRNNREDKKTLLAEHFGNKCVDCGKSYPPCVYDYHHRDPSTKEFEIGSKMFYTLERLIAEGEKCDLLCANCHRIRHFDSFI